MTDPDRLLARTLLVLRNRFRIRGRITTAEEAKLYRDIVAYQLERGLHETEPSVESEAR
jgi:hypothetical protein